MLRRAAWCIIFCWSLYPLMAMQPPVIDREIHAKLLCRYHFNADVIKKICEHIKRNHAVFSPDGLIRIKNMLDAIKQLNSPNALLLRQDDHTKIINEILPEYEHLNKIYEKAKDISSDEKIEAATLPLYQTYIEHYFADNDLVFHAKKENKLYNLQIEVIDTLSQEAIDFSKSQAAHFPELIEEAVLESDNWGEEVNKSIIKKTSQAKINRTFTDFFKEFEEVALNIKCERLELMALFCRSRVPTKFQDDVDGRLIALDTLTDRIERALQNEKDKMSIGKNELLKKRKKATTRKKVFSTTQLSNSDSDSTSPRKLKQRRKDIPPAKDT